MTTPRVIFLMISIIVRRNTFFTHQIEKGLIHMLKRIVVATLMGLTALTTQAEITPDTTINIIVPRNPGGGQDLGSRFVQYGLNKLGYENVVVLNKPGGADLPALTQLMNSENTDDNVYLFSFTHSNLYHPYLFEEPLYDVSDKVQPVMYLNEFNLQFLVPKSIGATNIEELKEYVKDNKVTVGSSAVGSSGHLLSTVAFNDYMDNVTFSYYKSDTENAAALARGDLTFGIIGANNKPVLGDRLDEFVAFKMEYPVPIWHGLVTNNTMPKEDVEKLNSLLQQVVADQEVIDKFLSTDDIPPVGTSTQYFRDVFEQTIEAGAGLSNLVKIK